MLVAEDKLDALVIDVTAEQRNQLKLFLSHVDIYGRIHKAESSRDARGFLDQHPDSAVDVFFISAAYASDDIAQLIEEMQKRPNTECSVFILLLSSQHGGEGHIATVADAFMVGAHACLSQPYSADNVREVTEHALKLRGQLREARDRTAIKCLLDDAAKYIDTISQLLVLSASPLQDLSRFRSVGRSITRLNERQIPLYYEMLIERFENARPPRPLPGPQNYTGKSKAMQRRAAAARERMRQQDAAKKDAEK